MAGGVAGESAGVTCQSVYEFNFLLSRYVHRSWWATVRFARPLYHRRRVSRIEADISDYLLDQFELAGHYCFEFEDPLARVALWRQSEIVRFLLFTGAALDAEAIRRILDGARIRRFKEEVGADVYGFVMHQMPLKGAAPVSGQMPALSAPNYRQRLLALGAAFAGRVLSGYSPALTRRLALKLPRRWLRYDELGQQLPVTSVEATRSWLCWILQTMEQSP